MICSESGAEDKITGQSSYFNVIEKLHVIPTHLQPASQLHQKGRSVVLRIAAGWARTDDDRPEQVFEVQTVLEFPGEAREVSVVGNTEISFPAPMHKILTQVALVALPGLGVLNVESRIRRKGATEWQKQIYPILIEQDPNFSPKPSGEVPPSEPRTGTLSAP